MNRWFVLAVSMAVLGLVTVTGTAHAQKIIGVAWASFQEERWKTDEAAMKSVIEAKGYRYISADAQSSNEKQIADIESLIARGAKALIVLAWDSAAVLPGIEKAKAEKIPVVGYDRLIEDPGVFYLTFDNVEVGRMQAREVYKLVPKGRYVFIKGYQADPNADFLHGGQLEVLGAAIKKGDIKVVGEQYTDGWKPEAAQANMEQILTANNNKVDAVVASNDGTAGGVVAALSSVGMEGIPVSGQDGDFAALNRVAKGLQTVSVWKDARELGKAAARIAIEMAEGAPLNKVSGATVFSNGPKKVKMNSVLLKPVPITRDNLDVVIKAGWVTKAVVCQGVTKNVPNACK